ncbi:hypothetical protein SAMN04488505_101349 [Chitinophaga rupis]|uniref:Uncharacterized protein n=1 Tax=Chitinophaga rupis TaxID=573321 RepID=A0A1H7HQS9_9BACT|nr:hypothetical protein SAMN04488505_101349 [Chitinophaga rupis]
MNEMAGFELWGLEIEYFNLGRNLIKNETRYQSGLQNIVGMARLELATLPINVEMRY